jgi:hypothetical protein
MRAGAEIRLLRDHGPALHDDFVQAVERGSITDARAVREGYIPWNLYPRPLVHEGSPLDLCPERTQH